MMTVSGRELTLRKSPIIAQTVILWVTTWQPVKKQSETQNLSEVGPFLTDNWEIGRKERGRGRAALREGNLFQGETSNVAIKNTFTVLESEKEVSEAKLEKEEYISVSSVLETHREFDKQIPLQGCATNREASVPGSSIFEEENQEGFSKKGGNQDLKPSFQVSDCVINIPDAEKKMKVNNLEELVIVEDVDEEEETVTPVPELPEKDDGSNKEKMFAGLSESSEIGQIVRGVATGVGVAQETGPERGRVYDEVDVSRILKKKEWTTTSEMKKGSEPVSYGPNVAAQIMVDPSPKVQKQERIEPASIPLSDTLISLGPSPMGLKRGFLTQRPVQSVQEVRVSPVAQNNINTEPKAQHQEGPESSHSQSDVIDNWLLSERRESMAGRRALNKDAVAFFPSFGSHHLCSEEGVDWGPDPLEYEGNYASDETTFSEFHLTDESFEDDFTVHPPLRRNSASDLQLSDSRKYSPPITRSRGIKLTRKKNKIRLG